MTFRGLVHRPFALILLGGTTVLLGLFALHAVWPFGGPGVDTFFGKWLNSAVCVLPGICLIAHALRRSTERAQWLLLGLASTLWGVGNTYFLLAYFDADTVPIPSLADGFWIAFYLTAYLGVVALMRARIAEFRRSMWLDGLIGATAVAAVAQQATRFSHASVRSSPSRVGAWERPTGWAETSSAPSHGRTHRCTT